MLLLLVLASCAVPRHQAAAPLAHTAAPPANAPVAADARAPDAATPRQLPPARTTFAELGPAAREPLRLLDPRPRPADTDPTFDAWLDERSSFYATAGHALGIEVTHWSIFRVVDFGDIPHPDATHLHYDGGASGRALDIPLPPRPTWADLWLASEALVKASGDLHHVFIEEFPVQGTGMELYTGS